MKEALAGVGNCQNSAVDDRRNFYGCSREPLIACSGRRHSWAPELTIGPRILTSKGPLHGGMEMCMSSLGWAQKFAEAVATNIGVPAGGAE